MSKQKILIRSIIVALSISLIPILLTAMPVSNSNLNSCQVSQSGNLIWSSNVDANGQRVTSNQLVAGRTYYLVVRGFINQGVWAENGRVLLNDACYEFNAKPSPDPLPIFQNDLGILVCDNRYHADHVYTSATFVSEGQAIAFWCFDTDYRDNSGSMMVEIFEVTTVAQPPQAAYVPQVTQGSGAFCSIGSSDKLFWAGDVSAMGQRITSTPLVAGNKYYIVVRGFINQGTWVENGRVLLNDACYEFNAKTSPDPLPIFQNNLGIIVCDNQYHSDHIYCSSQFESNGQPVTSWLVDTDYRDNSGTMHVEIYEVGIAAAQPPQAVYVPQVTQGSGAFCSIGSSDRLFWAGDVSAMGQRITSTPLVAGNRYYMVIRGSVNFGTSSVNGRILFNDACYEFNASPAPNPLGIFQNDLGIIVCDNQYHPDHIYCSSHFESNGQPVTSWLVDTDYRDNSGTMHVEIYEVGIAAAQLAQATQLPQVVQGSGAFCPIGTSDKLYWSGVVSSMGQRVTSTPLVAGNRYYMVIRGSVNFGTSSVNGRILFNDACYEFNASPAPNPLGIFQNDLGIIVCDNQYHPDHIYCSSYFESNGQPVTSWLVDTDYRDNSGNMRVEIYEVGILNIDDAIKELTENEDNIKWDNQKIKNAQINLNGLLNLERALYNQFNTNHSKFVKEINDQKTNPLLNEIVALCLASAQSQFTEHNINKDTIDYSGKTLLAQAATNDEIDMMGIISILSEVQVQSDDMTRKLSDMKDLLASRGADIEEIMANGQNLIAQGNVNPEFAQDGGVNVEFFGDGVDNFGDGLQDYLYGNMRKGNVLIIVWDGGNIADDIFEVSISGRGNLGTTPPGGRRNFDISLSPGTYTVNIKGVYTDPNSPPCTFGIQVYDRDTLILQDGNNIEENQISYYTITIR